MESSAVDTTLNTWINIIDSEYILYERIDAYIKSVVERLYTAERYDLILFNCESLVLLSHFDNTSLLLKVVNTVISLSRLALTRHMECGIAVKEDYCRDVDLIMTETRGVMMYTKTLLSMNSTQFSDVENLHYRGAICAVLESKRGLVRSEDVVYIIDSILKVGNASVPDTYKAIRQTTTRVDIPVSVEFHNYHQNLLGDIVFLKSFINTIYLHMGRRDKIGDVRDYCGVLMDRLGGTPLDVVGRSIVDRVECVFKNCENYVDGGIVYEYVENMWCDFEKYIVYLGSAYDIMELGKGVTIHGLNYFSTEGEDLLKKTRSSQLHHLIKCGLQLIRKEVVRITTV